MIELCDKLKFTNCEEDCWPEDIDERVAHLDFEDNSMSFNQSVFGNFIPDQTNISTDSLNISSIRQRCEANKNNDYKLMFEDSGQWTNSEVFPAVNVQANAQIISHDRMQRILGDNEATDQSFSLKLLEQLNDKWEDETDLRSKSPWNVPQATNKKRATEISSNEFCVTGTWRHVAMKNNATKVEVKGSEIDKTDLRSNKNANKNSTLENKTLNLLANFVEQQQILNNQYNEFSGQYPVDYRSSELHQERFDFNGNEINTLREVNRQRFFNEYVLTNNSPNSSTQNKLRSLKKNIEMPTDLTPSHTVPELNFIELSHKVPAVCRPSMSLNDIMTKHRFRGKSIDEIAESCMDGEIVIVDNTILDSKAESCHMNSEPDSGLGTLSNLSGPSHIDDWSSLSILLPRHVVDAYSFFKSNSVLLTGSADINDKNSQLDRRFSSNQKFFKSECPKCQNHSTFTRSEILSRELNHDPKQEISKSRLNLNELSLIGLPSYNQKRELVERVVSSVAEVARGAPVSVLISSLEQLLQDGLKSGYLLWEVVKGSINSVIASGVPKLNFEAKASTQTTFFLENLIKSKSFVEWLIYITSNAALIKYYDENAFLTKANNLYRTLFWRLVDALELFGVVSKSLKETCEQSDSNIPNLSDSSLLKQIQRNHASNEQTRITSLNPSRIPVLRTRSLSRRRAYQTTLFNSNDSIPDVRIARAKRTVGLKGEEKLLPLQLNEAVRILGVRGKYYRCCRLKLRYGTIINGKVPHDALDTQ